MIRQTLTNIAEYQFYRKIFFFRITIQDKQNAPLKKTINLSQKFVRSYVNAYRKMSYFFIF